MPKYKLYFSRDSTVLALPINPEKLPETISADNGKYSVLGLGQIMHLARLTFASFPSPACCRADVSRGKPASICPGGLHRLLHQCDEKKISHRLHPGSFL